ncbi:MAG: phenylpyruvate tautomerase MIF-related protein [Gammaproteobacteria bacterium]|nr:phenylpyruvate tautomerase MIF-related protein [Gammaproteobacteria bacterium]
MPLLKIHTNQSLDDAAQAALMQKASAGVAELLGKPEHYVMIALNIDQTMLFAGSHAPLAYLELKSIGLANDATSSLSAALCQLVSEALDIDQDRIYIEFTSAERHLWGWDGHTF